MVDALVERVGALGAAVDAVGAADAPHAGGAAGSVGMMVGLAIGIALGAALPGGQEAARTLPGPVAVPSVAAELGDAV